MKPIVKVKLLNEEAQAPCYAKEGDAGADLCCTKDICLMAGESALVPTGVAIQLPANHEAQVRPRSGLAYKKQITVLNTPGTIDEGYRGEVGVILINHRKTSVTLLKGERIAQLVIKPVEQAYFQIVEELDDTSRGEGGFGSTGA